MNENIIDDFVVINLPVFNSVVEKINADKLLLINVFNGFLETSKKINDLNNVRKIKSYENLQVSTRKHIIQLLKLDDCDIDFIKINKKFSISNCLDENEWNFKLFEVVRVLRRYGFNWREISEKITNMANCKLYDSNLSVRYYNYFRDMKYLE